MDDDTYQIIGAAFEVHSRLGSEPLAFTRRCYSISVPRVRTPTGCDLAGIPCWQVSKPRSLGEAASLIGFGFRLRLFQCQERQHAARSTFFHSVRVESAQI